MPKKAEAVRKCLICGAEIWHSDYAIICSLKCKKEEARLAEAGMIDELLNDWVTVLASSQERQVKKLSDMRAKARAEKKANKKKGKVLA